MQSVPRVGEYMTFTNKEVGDYFAWPISQITYRETGEIEIWTELFDDDDNLGYSFDTEEEFDEYYQSYLAEGWVCERGPKKNTRYKGDV